VFDRPSEYLQKENVPWRCDSDPFVSNHQCASTCSIYVEGSPIFQLSLHWCFRLVCHGSSS